MNSQDFLEISKQFNLGGLLTEQSHPVTEGLSELAKSNLPEAIQRMKQLDLGVFDVLIKSLPEIEAMYNSVKETFQQGKRVFICGCGSTGRLALTLETLYRQIKKADNVISFMSGGDVAIIASVEDFEDHPEFGAMQLRELGFSVGDLLIASTEGGETPWVIGATEEASKISKPYYLYCNPDEVLTVERSKRVLANPNIIKINLTVGSQAITGSTRMQCSTVLTYAIGLAILADGDFKEYAMKSIGTVQSVYSQLDVFQLVGKFIEAESDIYQANNYVFYRSSANIAINILTDTTERSPTFSLYPFESINDQPINPSLCYYVLDGVHGVEQAWETLFYGRKPRALEGEEWSKYKHKVSLQKMLSHDISEAQIARRTEYTNRQNYQFRIGYNDKLTFELLDADGKSIIKNETVALEDVLGQNIILKCILNIHSTLIMGRLGRYMSNIMIYVRPSNNKLIDRSIRYVQYLLKQNQINDERISYEMVCQCLFKEKETLVFGEAIVLKTYERVLKILQ